MGASLLAVAKSIYYTTTLRKMIKKEREIGYLLHLAHCKDLHSNSSMSMRVGFHLIEIWSCSLGHRHSLRCTDG